MKKLFELSALVSMVLLSSETFSQELNLSLSVEDVQPELTANYTAVNAVNGASIDAVIITATKRPRTRKAQPHRPSQSPSPCRTSASGVILSADIAITTASSDFALTSGGAFSQTVSVGVTLAVYDPDYREYIYSIVTLTACLTYSPRLKAGDSSIFNTASLL